MDFDINNLKKKKLETIPPTILEESTITNDSTAEVHESPKDTGLLRQTNIAVDQFRKVIQEHEAALARISRSNHYIVFIAHITSHMLSSI